MYSWERTDAVTATDLLLLADAHEAGDCPEDVLLDAIADLTKVHYQWRVHPLKQHWLDLVPGDTDPHWPGGLDGEPLLVHPESVATIDVGIYSLRLYPALSSWLLSVNLPGPLEATRRAATAAFARLLAGEE
jgi:hypothetical protein